MRNTRFELQLSVSVHGIAVSPFLIHRHCAEPPPRTQFRQVERVRVKEYRRALIAILNREQSRGERGRLGAFRGYQGKTSKRAGSCYCVGATSEKYYRFSAIRQTEAAIEFKLAKFVRRA